MRFFSILAIFLGIFLSLLFLNRQTIAERLITDRIEAIGCHKVQVTISELSSSKLTVASLAATLQNNSKVHHIQLHNLALHFSLTELLKGRIAGIDIDRLEIDLHKQKEKAHPPLSYQAIKDLLATTSLPPYLPQTISIQELIFSGPGAAPLTDTPLQLKSKILDSSLSITLLLPAKEISVEAIVTRLTNGAIHVQVDGHQATSPLFHLCLQHKHSESTGKLTILLNTLNILSPLLPISPPDISGKLELQFSARNTPQNPLEMELIVDVRKLSLPDLFVDSLTGKLALHANDLATVTFHRGSHFYICDMLTPVASLKKLYFQLTGKLARKEQQTSLSLGKDSRLLLEEFNAGSLQVDYAEITPALTFSNDLLTTTFSLYPEFTLALKQFQLQKLTIPELHLSPDNIISYTRLTEPTTGWNIAGGRIMVDINSPRFLDLLIHSTRLSLEIKDQENRPSPLHFHGLILNRTMSIQWKDKGIPLQDFQLEVKADNRNLQLNTAFSHPTIPGRIEGTAAHDMKQGRGKATFFTRDALNLEDEQTNIEQLITGLSLPFSLNSGLLDATVTLEWVDKTPLFINSRVQLTDGIGEYNNIDLSDVQLQQNLQILPRFRSLAPGHIFIGKLDTGLQINNISISNELTPGSVAALPILVVNSIEAEFLGGKIRSKNLHFDPSHPELEIPLQVEGMKLKDIINLNKIEDLSVTGILDGNLSIHLRNQKIETATGTLQSRAPGGVISYQPSRGNPALQQLPQYAIHALEEFHYKTLRATPHYDPSGTLLLNIHTEGRSPRVNTSRPIHLNLNTSQNLLSLLQSLRYTKILTDNLEKQLQNNQSKN